MKLDPTKAVILIPSLEPDQRLPAYARALLGSGFTRLVIVDDGSSEAYQPIFEELAALDGCTVLHHEVNRGKGVALKTGYAHIQQHMADATGVITADADGQHTLEDCWKLANALAEGKDELYLGSRDFDQADVPPKSRFGNKTTSAVFKLFYGQWLPDTQTGLRAFPMSRIGFMQKVTGERFEYEMNVLIACARAKMPMVPITIKTIYENENSGTHFHPIRDSYRIYKVILGSFVKFMGASVASAILDYIVFLILENWILTFMTVGRAFVSTVIARCVSAPCNFMLNKKLVFKHDGDHRTFVRYVILAVCLLLASALGVETVMDLLQLPPVLAGIVKALVDLVLYMVSYRVQNHWVFREEDTHA